MSLTKRELRKLITDQLDRSAATAYIQKLSTESQQALRVSTEVPGQHTASPYMRAVLVDGHPIMVTKCFLPGTVSQ
jgi:hypothetical protein